jgi:hypothetical protein
MNWYIVDTATTNPITGPFASENAAREKFMEKLEDKEWRMENGIDNSTEDGAEWFVSGWKAMPEWWAEPVDAPSRNPTTSWTIHFLKYDISIFIEQAAANEKLVASQQYTVSICDESEERKGEVILGEQCSDFGEAILQVMSFAAHHEQYHEYEESEVSLENIGVDADSDVVLASQ